jgi:glyoxylase-like metal-dependent hydrolase (beta-lactamase superfamily II)
MVRFAAVPLLLGQLLLCETVYPPGQAVLLGVLPAKWTTGGPRCTEVPEWQVHEYNEDFFILRESGCTHYEKPFLYLLFGSNRALLVDTGAGKADVARAVYGVIGKWVERTKRTAPMPLTVMHSHGHGDHTAGDKQFEGKPEVTFVAATPAALEKAFGIAPFPTGQGSVDLGGRVLDVLAIPGHEEASVAVYDRQTGILLSGDTVYPGRLYVRDWAAYAASAQRLVEFTEGKPITHVLGAHIEQARTPYSDYDRGTSFQPDEHELSLTRAHLLEWNEALKKANGTPAQIALRDFTIVPPRAPRPAAQPGKPSGEE